MSNKPISICKDPLIQWNGSRMLYRDCQLCAGQAAYLYTFEGELTGREQSVPLCERHGRVILGPESEELSGMVQFQPDSWLVEISLEEWVNKVKHGYTGHFNNKRCVAELDENTQATVLMWVTVKGIEEGL